VDLIDLRQAASPRQAPPQPRTVSLSEPHIAPSVTSRIFLPPTNRGPEMSFRSRAPNPDPELLLVEDAEFLEQLQLLEKHSSDGDLRELCVERVCCFALTGLNPLRLQCLLPKLSVIICVARSQGGLLLYAYSRCSCKLQL